ncbi:UNVERIFIED_CONTAM: putative anthocyanidin reductase [Sesamum angustifolium]|uniref:Anthocyanidin reductase n=1 Tax=Sesamum angustifolium TaxID=2727405 RepID=A0AAW2PBI9_9LAMI
MEDLTPRAHEVIINTSQSESRTPIPQHHRDLESHHSLKFELKLALTPVSPILVVNLGAVNPIDKEGEEGAGNSGNGGSPELLCSKQYSSNENGRKDCLHIMAPFLGSRAWLSSALQIIVKFSDCLGHGPFWEPQKASHLFKSWQGRDRLRLFRADLLEDGSFDEAVIGCDGVFHVAASMEFGVPAVEDLAIRGTLNVLKACLRSNTARRIVFTSSISTLTAKNSSGGWIPIVDEACQTHAHHVYALSKLLTEEAAFQYAEEENGIDLISVVTTTVGGPFLLNSSIKHSSSHLPNYSMEQDSIPAEISSKKIRDMGFEFKYGIQDIIHQTIRKCVDCGFLSPTSNE